jgi:hypothetical protein
MVNDDSSLGLRLLICPCPEDILMLDTEAERSLQDRIHLLEKHFNIKVKNAGKRLYKKIIENN